MQSIAILLRDQPLLYGVPFHELETAAAKMETLVVPAGGRLIEEGALEETCYLITGGQVRVVTNNLIGEEVTLAEFGPGSVIGEIGLLWNERRTAGVMALSEVTAVCLRREAFAQLAEASPLFYESIRMFAEIRYVHGLLRKASIWAPIPDSELRGLAEITVRRQVRRGDAVIREGDASEYLYMIGSGRFEVSASGRRIAVLSAGDYFGELALMSDTPHAAMVKALEDGELLLMGKAEFAYVLQQYPPILHQFAEVVHIRRPDITLSDWYASRLSIMSDVPDPSSSEKQPDPDSMMSARLKRYWVDGMLGMSGLFILLTVMSIWQSHPIWHIAALVVGGFVGPVSFVLYMRSAQLLGFGFSRLAWIFVATAIVAIPLAWWLERLWVFQGSAEASFGHWQAPLAVAVIEEIAKLLICSWLLRLKRHRFLMDAVVFGAAAGMGFAAVESVIYGWSHWSNGSTISMLAVLAVRALLSPFGHGTWSAIAAVGLWYVLTKGQLLRWQSALLAMSFFAIALLLHFLWDYQVASGFWRMLLMLAVGAAGLLVLAALLRSGRYAEQQALLRMNPGLEPTVPSAARRAEQLQCEACGTQSPAVARYCARCGQSLRLRA
ncbi:cyclic nucleotide-binding domain-containing protein [Paenibacillus sp. GCM10027628]|uniref:cyclic nucleotide-binding domain-containing protein n=1 Tax=Paenibacillus sp. GCM10027628 TaxID=3273413 RepID=UPI003645C1F0